MSKPSVAIIYGFAEGPWHGKRFRRELIAQGFRLADTADTADIIISHSGGCFYLPPNGSPLIILINPPFWPGKPLTLSMLQKTLKDRRQGFLIKTFWNITYMLSSPFKLIYIARHSSDKKFILALKQRRVVIVRNRGDPFLTPQASSVLKTKTDFDYYELPGKHDDCWLNPAPYVEVIKSVYDTRRAH